MARVPNAIVIEAPQRSEEWFSARRGNVTGSKGKDVIRVAGANEKNAAIRELLGVKQLSAKLKESPEFQELNALSGMELYKRLDWDLPDNEKRIKYKRTRVAERLSGMTVDSNTFVSEAMKWGTINEKYALAKYQMDTENIVNEAFFLLHPTLRVGASPDGNVIDRETGEIGVLEIKCLNSDNHLYEIMRTQRMPEDYFVQVQMEMWLSDTDWCDFVGYDSRLPGKLDYFRQRVPRDNVFIDEILEPEIIAFLAEVDRDEKLFRVASWKGFENMFENKEEGIEELVLV